MAGHSLVAGRQASPRFHTGETMSQPPVTTPQPVTGQNDPKRFTWTTSSQQRRGQTMPIPAGSSGK
ncbi:hypothetical protein D3C86_385060 [compost metagenome]